MLLPPVVLDDPFWRAFWSGPPAAGIFAVLAAAIAFYPAFRSTHIAKENAAREQWWNRAEWALQLATSDRQTDREVAKDALIALSAEATELESGMIIRVVLNSQDDENQDIDGSPELADNWGRRCVAWLTRSVER